MHRNLLLTVNFLPVNVALDDDAAWPAHSLAGGCSDPDVPETEVSVADVEDASTGLSLAESGVSSGSDSSTAHTSAWDQQLPPAM